MFLQSEAGHKNARIKLQHNIIVWPLYLIFGLPCVMLDLCLMNVHLLPCYTQLWLCTVLPPSRDPSEHFCGTPTHHSDLPAHEHWLHLDPSHHQEFQKVAFDHDRIADDAVSSGKERDRLKRQSSSGTMKDSCPMNLVATHSFISMYGVKDAIQFMVSGLV